MMVNRHKYFRWTGRTARITFAYMVAFPALIGYLAYTTDVSWNLLGLKDCTDISRENGICGASGGGTRFQSFRWQWGDWEESLLYICGEWNIKTMNFNLRPTANRRFSEILLRETLVEKPNLIIPGDGALGNLDEDAHGISSSALL